MRMFRVEKCTLGEYYGTDYPVSSFEDYHSFKDAIKAYEEIKAELSPTKSFSVYLADIEIVDDEFDTYPLITKYDLLRCDSVI